MNIVIRTVNGERRAELPRLAQAMRASAAIPGPIDLIYPEVEKDRLGPLPEAITVAVAAVGAGGSITVAVRELIHALLRRHSDLEVSISIGPDQKISVAGRDLARLNSDELAALVERIAGTLQETAERSRLRSSAEPPASGTPDDWGKPG